MQCQNYWYFDSYGKNKSGIYNVHISTGGDEIRNKNQMNNFLFMSVDVVICEMCFFSMTSKISVNSTLTFLPTEETNVRSREGEKSDRQTNNETKEYFAKCNSG